MKKLAEKLEEKDAARRKLRKERWHALSPRRKFAYRSLWTLAIAILIFGIATKTIHTSMMVAMFLVMIIAPIVKGGPRIKRNLISNALTFPLVPMILGAAIGGPFMDIDYKAVLDEQKLVAKFQDEIARDAKQFSHNYHAGKTETLGTIDFSDGALLYGKNDRLAYLGLKKVMDLARLSAPEGTDVSGYLPLAEAIYGDRSMVIMDREVAAYHQEKNADRIAKKLGKSRDDLTVYDWAENPAEYPGITLLTCTVKDDGEVLLAAGAPLTFYSDLRKIPAASPLIEICRTAALGM